MENNTGELLKGGVYIYISERFISWRSKKLLPAGVGRLTANRANTDANTRYCDRYRALCVQTNMLGRACGSAPRPRMSLWWSHGCLQKHSLCWTTLVKRAPWVETGETSQQGSSLSGSSSIDGSGWMSDCPRLQRMDTHLQVVRQKTANKYIFSVRLKEF